MLGSTSNSSYLRIGKTSGTPSAYGDWIALDFLHVNEVSPTPQFTGNPAARLSAVLERGDNGYGLAAWTRNRHDTFTEKLRVTADGNVGIGTTNPDAKLAVNGTLNLGSQSPSDNQVRLFYDRDDFPGIFGFLSHGGNNGFTIGTQTNSATNTLSGDIKFLTSNDGSPTTMKAVIKGNGNIGIGTAAPLAALHVAAPSATSLVESTDSGAGVALTFRTDAADRWRNVVNGSGLNYRYDWESSGASGPVMSLTTDGRVGVGITSPDAKLAVSGGLSLGSQTSSDNQIRMYYDRDEFPGIYGFIMHRGEAGGQGGLTIGAQTDSNINPYSGDIRFLTSSDGSPATPKLVIRSNGSISCGALVEANLQTEAETTFGHVQRFDEGAVLCWGLDQLELCTAANDRLVQAVADSEGRPIVIGAEKVKVLGSIRRGDILVASDVAGYAMVNDDPRSGSVIAQALEDFDGEHGIIKAMIRKF